MNLTKELENAGYKAVVMPVVVGARGFVGSSVYDLLTFNMWQQKNNSSKVTSGNSRKKFPVDLEQEK